MTRYVGDKGDERDKLIGRPGETHPDWSFNPEKLLIGLEGEEEDQKLKLALRLRVYKGLLKLAEAANMSNHEFTVYFLCKFMEMDYREVEEITGASQNSLSTTCSRAKEKLDNLNERRRG